MPLISGTELGPHDIDCTYCVATSEQAMYDVSKDGRRFLVNTHMKADEVHPLTVILNWQAEFRK
jgi:hypothetical protein